MPSGSPFRLRRRRRHHGVHFESRDFCIEGREHHANAVQTPAIILAPLLTALAEADDAAREELSRAVSGYGNAAVTALTRLTQSGQSRTRLAALQTLANIASNAYYSSDGTLDAQGARAVLDQAMRRNDFGVAVAIHDYYINAGDPEAVPFLTTALSVYGTQPMALALLNSGMPALEQAARNWAAANGYAVESRSVSRRDGPRWGSRR